MDVPVEALTNRMRHIGFLVACGFSAKEVAAMLVRSVDTVDNTLSRLMKLVGVRNRVELARWAVRSGLAPIVRLRAEVVELPSPVQPEILPLPAVLSTLEVRAIALYASDFTHAEAARRLGAHVRSFNRCIARAVRKLRLPNRVRLVAWAASKNLVAVHRIPNRAITCRVIRAVVVPAPTPSRSSAAPSSVTPSAARSAGRPRNLTFPASPSAPSGRLSVLPRSAAATA